jgi:hypothetical protein
MSEWTIETFRVLVQELMDAHDRRYEERFQAQDRALQAALVESQRALTKAEHALEKRLDLLNEMRAAMSDQAQAYLPRSRYDSEHDALEEKIQVNATRLEKLEARAGGLNNGWILFGQIVSLIASTVAILMTFFRR